MLRLFHVEWTPVPSTGKSAPLNYEQHATLLHLRSFDGGDLQGAGRCGLRLQARRDFPEMQDAFGPLIEDFAGPLAMGLFHVAEDELPEELRIFRLDDPLDGDQFRVVTMLEFAAGVVDEGEAVGHARRRSCVRSRPG